jgi:hypothetical protein
MYGSYMQYIAKMYNKVMSLCISVIFLEDIPHAYLDSTEDVGKY